MKLVLFGPALIGMVTTISAISISTVFKEGFRKEWEAFKAEYGKVYSSSAEEEFRMTIFLDNMAYIATMVAPIAYICLHDCSLGRGCHDERA